MITAKAVIFDTDGTLVNTIRRFYTVLNRMLEERGDEPLGWEEFLGQYTADTLDDLAAPPGTDGRDEKLHRFWIDFFRKYREIEAPGDELIPGARETIEKISETGVPIAISTICIVPPDKLREELDGYGVAKFADAIVTGHNVVEDLEHGHHFSKVELFGLAAREIGADIADCVVVGDYWNDVRDAKQLGAKVVGVMTGLVRREVMESYEPDVIIDSVKDLLNVVKFER